MIIMCKSKKKKFLRNTFDVCVAISCVFLLIYLYKIIIN
jgi:hypothetical protein